MGGSRFESEEEQGQIAPSGDLLWGGSLLFCAVLGKSRRIETINQRWEI